VLHLSEYEKAKHEGFIGIEGDIYVRQLTRNHAVLIENVEDSWISYRLTWEHKNGQLKKSVDISEPGSFENALTMAVDYIEWFKENKPWKR
jgi:hypothetical protein